MDSQSRMLTLLGVGLCALGAAALSQVDTQAAGDASQALEDYSLALLQDLGGEVQPAPAATPPAQPAPHQPTPAQPAPVRPPQRASRR